MSVHLVVNACGCLESNMRSIRVACGITKRISNFSRYSSALQIPTCIYNFPNAQIKIQTVPFFNIMTVTGIGILAA